MTEVFINGSKIDVVDDEIITATYGNISFGDFNKKNGIKSNNFKIPITNKNKEIFENAELITNNSNIPYQYLDYLVTIHGVEIVKGLGFFTGKSGKFYNVMSVGGISEFYKTIGERKLTDLDLSEYNHTWNKETITQSWSNTKGYTYGFVNYGPGFTGNRIPPDFMLPQTFFHTVVRKIVEEAGYTIEGKVLKDDRFLRHIIGFSRFPESLTFEGPVVLSDTLPDVLQSKAMLDFLNVYGLMPNVNNDDKIITFDYIDDIIFNEPIDWSDKIDNSEESEFEPRLDFFQESKFSWKTDDVIEDGREHSVFINDLKLDNEGFVYKSEFFIPDEGILGLNRSTGWMISVKESQGYRRIDVYDPAITFDKGQNVYYNGSYYQALLLNGAGDPKTPGLNAEYWKPVNKKDIFTYKQRIFYGVLETNPSVPLSIAFTSGDVPITKVVLGDLLDWLITYEKHYRLFEMIIQKPKVIKQLMKLSYSDINQLKFNRPYILGGEYGSTLFILEEVSQFKLNDTDSTYCTFIRI